MEPEGRAVVYCQSAFGTTNGKTAHGLVRRSRRYEIAAVIDSRHAGSDAGVVLDGDRGRRGIPVVASLAEALATTGDITHFVVGLAPDGGRLSREARADVLEAIEAGLHVDCGLHDFLNDDEELSAAAARSGSRLRDIRRPPPREELHFWSGKIGQVDSLKVALLGTDSAVGKRTTAWLLVDALEAAGHRAELIGTGQTAWLQGARYSIVVDSLVSDFMAGEIEHAAWQAWHDLHPAVLVLEGQGSLMNPAYPGGYELLAAGRPEVIVLQHAPARHDYDGFPGYPIHPLERQIQAIEIISDRPVVAVTLNHEGMDEEGVESARQEIVATTGLPVIDPLLDGADELVRVLRPHLERTSVRDAKG